MSIFRDEKIWRIITNFWTALFIVFLIANFFSLDKYEYLIAPFSVVYIGVLSLYVGTKEFDRWYELHEGRHPGEIFVIVWTVVIVGLFALSFSFGSGHRVSSEVVADYIMVLSIFALTQKSKRLHKEKTERNQLKNASENKTI